MLISLPKLLLFNLARKNRFVVSDKTIRNCFEEITEKIEKFYKITLTLSQPSRKAIENIFYNQFYLIKKNWKKKNGGYSRNKYLETIEKQYLEFSLNDSDFKSDGKLFFDNTHIF
jgi:hypothetical protein